MSDRTLDLLYVRTCTLAERVASGELGFIDAVDMAYSAADWAGVVQRYGDDLVQAVLAEAFICVPRTTT
jgi:hypothetical protein